MTKNARLEKVREYLKQNKSATIQELATMLDVSHMTIRRDLAMLAQDDKLKLIHGGVIFHEEEEHKDKYTISLARIHMQEEKKRIALKAVSLIEKGDIIIIDAGSTGELIASYLPENIPLTVICFALNIATIVASKPNCSLIVTGGFFHHSSLVLESTEGLNLLKQNRANKTFITASGVSVNLGVTCSNFFERTTKQASLKAANTKILVADSSKFDLIKSGHFADLSDFDIVITDNKVSEKIVSQIQALENLKLYCV
ncbi:transcriptional regulator of sugar metabolism [Sphaerochaeta pleomorpha str. Grapes]|uniref:Transcriptional regulator of sugar metabolism n=1 Tax=Sphaerochaeta pleomorpha (strain ATCC BAA-1885 / DSM 22778 / Grapes) TaxID=158190 RepID=G8QVP8_SPHPG|nr:DeoR/GlpR family DNA-binding transcription regulator [Sphaerochaeta pleomorpha]AEV29340.1 transcriptional regulator of sugar metabolism [Sphaerochaeta pleomorpha str. Grapes]